jgi:hypothetical protein
MEYKVIHNQSETFTYMGQFHCYPSSVVKLPAHVADHVVASYDFFVELPLENYEHLTPFNSVDFATYVDAAPTEVAAITLVDLDETEDSTQETEEDSTQETEENATENVPEKRTYTKRGK